MASGVNSRLNVGLETTFKSSPTDGFILPINSSNMRINQNVQAPDTIRGSRSSAEPSVGNKSCSGNIVVPVDSEAFWYWLRYMFGAPTTTGASSPYTHEFKNGTTQPSFTLEHYYDLGTDQYGLFNGCKINGFSISVGGDGELTASLDVVGAKYTLGSSSFDASPTTITMARLKNFQASLTEGGSSFAYAEEMSIKIDFGNDTSHFALGASGELGQIPDGIVKVTGSLKAMFEDTTLLAKAAANTESALILTLNGGSTSQLIFEIPELIYTPTTPPIDGPKGIVYDLEFTGYYGNGADASNIVVTCVNTTEHAGGV